MEAVYGWIAGIAIWVSGILYAQTRERREDFKKRMLICSLSYIVFLGVLNLFPVREVYWLKMVSCAVVFLVLVLFIHLCWNIRRAAAFYYAIWAFMSWQLLYELWAGIRIFDGSDFWRGTYLPGCSLALIFIIGYLFAGFTITRWVPEGAPKNMGPRQLTSAFLIFGVFEMIGFTPRKVFVTPGDGKWEVLYLSQLLMAVILTLQSELFKKSAMRQELQVMNLLWKKEQEQYQLAKENIALINQKCHDLKHQVRAIRNASQEDIDGYLKEMEDSIHIYEAIVKTGNEVLDTILTEKSLYCKEKNILVSCVADGSQMDFINAVDLYAILGNALDNAIEAVEKFTEKEKRQIDVLIYRQQNFLAMNIINPMQERLVYEEELPVTTKGDRRYHGYGLRSMQYMVKKYDGFLSVSEEDGCFSLKILIPIQEKNA